MTDELKVRKEGNKYVFSSSNEFRTVEETCAKEYAVAKYKAIKDKISLFESTMKELKAALKQFPVQEFTEEELKILELVQKAENQKIALENFEKLEKVTEDYHILQKQKSYIEQVIPELKRNK